MERQFAPLQSRQLLTVTPWSFWQPQTAQEVYPKRFHFISFPVPRVSDAWEFDQRVL